MSHKHLLLISFANNPTDAEVQLAWLEGNLGLKGPHSKKGADGLRFYSGELHAGIKYSVVEIKTLPQLQAHQEALRCKVVFITTKGKFQKLTPEKAERNFQ